MNARHATFVALAAAALSATPLVARDYGQQGAVFPIIEPDLLTTIEARLIAAERSGKVAAMNRDLTRRTRARVSRPAPVRGIGPAIRGRAWIYDPTITVGEDIRDRKGRLIIARGARVNPLDTAPLRARLVFFDGDAADQVKWALAKTTSRNAKLILTKGAPLALMKRHQRRFYFDQGGALTSKFAVRHVPAVVEQQGRRLRVSEVALVRAVRPQPEKDPA